MVPATVMGEADASRPPAVGAPRWRAPLRPGPAPARAARHQGHRPRSAPVQQRDLHSAAGVEPRLRDPVGQHLALALRHGPSRPAWQEIPGTASGARRLDRDWSGLTATVAGDYQLRTYSAGDIEVDAGDHPVIEHWRQGWLPSEDVAHLSLRTGESVPVRFAGRRTSASRSRVSRRSRRSPPATDVALVRGRRRRRLLLRLRAGARRRRRRLPAADGRARR